MAALLQNKLIMEYRLFCRGFRRGFCRSMITMCFVTILLAFWGIKRMIYRRKIFRR